jgi:hypothetical protein
MVRKTMATLCLSAAFLGLPAMVGCDRTVSHERTVSESPTGSTKVKDQKVVEKADGTIEKKTETKKVNP